MMEEDVPHDSDVLTTFAHTGNDMKPAGSNLVDLVIDPEENITEVVPITSRGDEGILEGVTINDTTDITNYSSESDEGVRANIVHCQPFLLDHMLLHVNLLHRKRASSSTQEEPIHREDHH